MNRDTKGLPILASFILFLALCVSGTFWALQFFKPVPRLVVAPKAQAVIAANPEAAFALFGGRPAAVAPASNFQLKGVVVSRNPLESIAILVADGKPAVAVRVNAEVSPGVTVTEVGTRYVLLSEGGVIKRVELPASAPPMRVEPPLNTPSRQEPIIQPPPMPNGPPMQASPMPPSGAPPSPHRIE